MIKYKKRKQNKISGEQAGISWVCPPFILPQTRIAENVYAAQ